MKSITLNFAPATSSKPFAIRALAAMVRIFNVRRQRKQLSQLSPELLRDIGLDSSDVKAELKRPVWDAPSQFIR